MLDFYIGTGGIEALGEHLGGIEMEEMEWLQRNNFIPGGVVTHQPVSSGIPYFDDSIFNHEQVSEFYFHFMYHLQLAASIPGFKAETTTKLERILSRAFESGCGMSTLAD
jgi:hypothetical protein